MSEAKWRLVLTFMCVFAALVATNVLRDHVGAAVLLALAARELIDAVRAGAREGQREKGEK